MIMQLMPAGADTTSSSNEDARLETTSKGSPTVVWRVSDSDEYRFWIEEQSARYIDSVRSRYIRLKATSKGSPAVVWRVSDSDEYRFWIEEQLARYKYERSRRQLSSSGVVTGYQERPKASEQLNQNIDFSKLLSPNKGLRSIQANLVDLFREEDEETIPTEYAFTTAWQLVFSAASFLRDDFPKAHVATDDEGGIRLRWRSADRVRDVRLYCPANREERMYIYHQEGDKYDGDYKVTGFTLARWLYWMVKSR